jgi:hypothetical protein
MDRHGYLKTARLLPATPSILSRGQRPLISSGSASYFARRTGMGLGLTGLGP